MALRDVMNHAVAMQREVTKPTALRGSRRVLLLSLLIVPIAALAGWSWFARPEFIWGPKRVVAPVRQDADMRLAMYLLSRRLENLRTASGAYPSSLAGITHPGTAITYRLVSDSLYELSAMQGGKLLLYRSDMPAAQFVGNAARVIAGPGTQ